MACLSSGIKPPPPILAGWRIPACGIYHEQSRRAKATTVALSGMLARNDNESAFSVHVCVCMCVVLFLLALFVVFNDAGCFVLSVCKFVCVSVCVREL